MRLLARRSSIVPISAALNELVKPADFSVRGSVLIKERKALLLELVEEVVPVDRFQALVARLKVKPKDAGLPAFRFRSFDRRRHAASLFCPLPNLLVVGGDLAFRHFLASFY